MVELQSMEASDSIVDEPLRCEHAAAKLQKLSGTEPCPQCMFLIPRDSISDLNRKFPVEWCDLDKLNVRVRPYLRRCLNDGQAILRLIFSGGDGFSVR